MANTSKGASRTVIGQKLDFHAMMMGEGDYAFGLNARIENFDGLGFPVIQNEPSNILCTGFPEDFFVVGFVNIVEQERIIWFLANPDGETSAIGETKNMGNCRENARNGIIQGACDDCAAINLKESTPLEKIDQQPCCIYRNIITDDCLNFTRAFPVDSVEYRIIDCGIEVFFTDKNNPRRHIIFEYENDDPTGNLIIKQEFFEITGFNTPPCEDPIYGTGLDCNRMNIQPDITTPCIDFVDLVSGGSNKAGVYQFFIAFSDALGNKLSSYFSSTNPIPIRTKDITFETNYVTDRAIQLKIENLDDLGPFQYYTLAVAKTIDAFTAFYEVGTFPVTQKIYNYTGNNEAEQKLTAGDIFQRFPYYKTAGHVTASNNILFWADLAEFPKLNLQRVANNITLQWQTIAIPEDVYKNPRNVNMFRSCMRDEVYPYGIVFIFENGEESPVFHIPGREAISSDLEIIANGDVIEEDTCAEETRNLRWQVYNTGTIEGGDLTIYQECEETCYQYGDFSYWESTKRYPNIPEIWGDLCGEPIRHHKYPDSSITHIHNHQNSSGDFFENNLVFPIGVKVDHDSVRASIADAVTNNIFTQADADRIVGYRIVRGNRFQNKSVIAKGLLYDVNQYQRKDGATTTDAEPIYFANYPYNDLRDNPFITDQLDNYDNHDDPQGADLPFTFSKRYTFHSPDTHFSEPTIGTEVKLESVEYGESEGYFTKSKKQAKQKLLSNSSYFLALTGGIVAALLRTQEKECVQYTIKSDYTEDHGEVHVDSSTFNTGQDITGAGATTITTINAGGSIGAHDENQDDSTEAHNALDPSLYTWDTSDGSAGPPKDNTGADIATVETVTGETCKGTREQYFNGLTTDVLNDFIPGLGTAVSSIFTIVGQVEDFARVVFEEMNIILRLIESLTPFRDWTVQYHSVGKYNNYKTVGNSGNKRRKILSWSYLKPENQLVPEEVNTTTGQFNSIHFNNWHRESSLYLKHDGNQFPNPSGNGQIDNSRPTMEDTGFDCDLDKKAYRTIASYYASLKEFVPDQYGTIYDIEYLPTDSCIFDIDTSNDDCRGVYGGDTFINRFALKIKVPYFLATTFGLPQGTDFNFSEVPNLAYPRHYYNNTNTLGSEFTSLLDIFDAINIFDPDAMFDLYGRPKSIRDCDTNKFFYQNGYIYLFHYGVPYFLVESDVNVDYRHGENTTNKDFFPHNTDLYNWLQEETVPISEDNFYFYNRAYSKQNKETPFTINNALFEPSRDCLVEHPNRIIYTRNRNWLVYLANDFIDYPLNKGEITSVEGIENDTVLVRTTNTTSVFPSVIRTQVSGQNVQIGNAGIFANPPQEFAETTLGYVGSQHKAILHTEYGHIWADAKRGQVFNLAAGGRGLDEISKDGMKNWFKENLPFQVLRDFSNISDDDIDNNFAGVGLTMSFDKRNNRFLLTKLDYRLKRNVDIVYNSDTKEFLLDDETPVRLGDKRYFIDKSWTLSYNFFTKAWTSFYSFKPNYYVDFIDYFGSGVDSGMWLHNLTNSSFQVFYGKLYPFIFEPVLKFDAYLKALNSIEFDTEVRRYDNEWDYTIKKGIPGVNKAIIYNDVYNSGLLELVKTNKNDISNAGKYPIRNLNNWNIEIALSNYKWRFNQFYNLVKDNSEIPLFLYKGNNAEKDLNPAAFNYRKNDFDLARMKGQWFKVRLINDKLSNYKILHKFTLDSETMQFK